MGSCLRLRHQEDDGDIGEPFLVRFSCFKLLFEPVGSHRMAVLAIGCYDPTVFAFDAQPLLTHQTCYALARATQPPITQLDMNARTSIRLSILVVDPLNLLSKCFILKLMV